MDDLVEKVARAIHEHLCQRDIMQYLDNEEDCEGLAQAAIAAARTAVMEWQPIETAPNDVLCLLFEPHDEGGFCFVGCTNIDGKWVNNLDFIVQTPTHWMPLPATPEAIRQAGRA